MDDRPSCLFLPCGHGEVLHMNARTGVEPFRSVEDICGGLPWAPLISAGEANESRARCKAADG